MNTNYISESLSPSEVFRKFGDQVPEFMQTWLEQIVNLAQDAEEIYAVLYNNSELDVDSSKFEESLVELTEQAAKYDEHREEIVNLEYRIKELAQDKKELYQLLLDNNIDF